MMMDDFVNRIQKIHLPLFWAQPADFGNNKSIIICMNLFPEVLIFSVWDILLSDDCIWEPAQNGLAFKGKVQIKEYLENFFKKTSQVELKGKDLFQTGYQVIFRWEMDGIGGVDIFKFRKKLICEVHSYTKNMTKPS